MHGSGDIPPDLQDPSHPDWVEAGRWLERQRDLYHRQKLLLLRVRLIKEALGERDRGGVSGRYVGVMGALLEGSGRWVVAGDRMEYRCGRWQLVGNDSTGLAAKMSGMQWQQHSHLGKLLQACLRFHACPDHLLLRMLPPSQHDAGVKLVREHSRPRRNLHPVLKAGNADFRAQQRQRQGGEAGEQQEQGKRAQRRPQRRRQLQPRQQQQQQQPPQAAEEP